MAKKKVKKKSLASRKNKVWKQFCSLSLLDKYILVYDTCFMYDDFRNMLDSPEDYSLRDLERDVSARHKTSKKSKL